MHVPQAPQPALVAREHLDRASGLERQRSAALAARAARGALVAVTATATAVRRRAFRRTFHSGAGQCSAVHTSLPLGLAVLLLLLLREPRVSWRRAHHAAGRGGK